MTDSQQPDSAPQLDNEREVTALPGRSGIRDRFDRKQHLFSTRAAECFQAEDRSTGAIAHLWLLRFPLSVHSEESARFVRRIKRISQLRVGIPEVLQYGVDSAGAAFLVTAPLAQRSVIEGADQGGDGEALFREILKLAAELHANGIFLGDISEDSFALDREGRVLLVGLMGTFDAGARQTAMLPPADTYHYLAPEQRSGSGPDILTDVYALGVYGYRLLTGRYLMGNKAVGGPVENPVMSAPAPTVVKPHLSRWVDDVLGRCLEIGPDQRFRDAGQILDVVEEATRTGLAPGGSSAWSRRTVLVHPHETPAEQGKDYLPIPSQRSLPTKTQRMENDEGRSGRKKLLLGAAWVAAVFAGAAFAIFVFYSVGSWTNAGKSAAKKDADADSAEDGAMGDLQNPIILQSDYAPPELRPLISAIGASELALEKRKEALAAVSQSDEPIAYAVMIATAKSHNENVLRAEAQRLLAGRIKNSGLVRSASVIESWSELERGANRDPADSPAYGLMLTACAPARSIESRKKALLKTYGVLPDIAVRLTAALALDESEEKFAPVLRKMIAGSVSEQELSSRGIGALLFSSPVLLSFFAADIGGLLPRFSDADLRWALTHSEGLVRTYQGELLREALSRKLLDPFHSAFLEALAQPADVNRTEVVSEDLLRAALGEVDESQVDAFARWVSPYSDIVLLAVCVVAKDRSVAQDAFDILAGRSVRVQPAESLIKWVKSYHWDRRRIISKAIGILGLIDRASAEDVNEAFNTLMPYSGGVMFRVIVGSGSQALIRAAVNRMGPSMTTEVLLGLLDYPEKDVRMAVVAALRDRNELVALQGVLRGYERERDEEVRQKYREMHWVTRERDKKIVR